MNRFISYDKTVLFIMVSIIIFYILYSYVFIRKYIRNKKLNDSFFFLYNRVFFLTYKMNYTRITRGRHNNNIIIVTSTNLSVTIYCNNCNNYTNLHARKSLFGWFIIDDRRTILIVIITIFFAKFR